jgi:hypothetical protein
LLQYQHKSSTSSGSLSYIDNVMSEANFHLGEQKIKEMNSTAQECRLNFYKLDLVHRPLRDIPPTLLTDRETY